MDRPGTASFGNMSVVGAVPATERICVSGHTAMSKRRISRPLLIGLLLAITSFVFWLDGHWNVGSFTLAFPSRESSAEISSAEVALFHGNGRLCLQYMPFSRRFEDPGDAKYYRRTWDLGYSRWEIQHLAPDQFAESFFDDPLNWRLWGYGLYECGRQGASIVQLEIPVWLFAAVGIALAVVPLIRRLRKKFGGTGRCVQCGYDLRATPDRCPECGGVPAGAR